MERIQVTVERSYRKDIIFLISVYLVFFLLSGRNEKYEEISFWAFLLVAVVGECLLEKYAKKTRTLEVEFQEAQVVFGIGGKVKVLLYKEIIEVQKIMKITRFISEKGYYRVRVKTKRGSICFYTLPEEYEKHLDFEKTELAAVYNGFREHGVKCC